jgi:hypothetical protein
VRQAILREDVREALNKARAQGLTPSQAAQAALADAHALESEQPNHEECIRQLAASNPDAMIRALQNGTYRFAERQNALSSCAAEYVNYYYAVVALKEMAIAMACMANK